MKKIALIGLICCFTSIVCGQVDYLDTTFASQGTFFQDSMYPTTFIIQSDGKILMGGETYHGTENMGLLRLNPDGTLDSTFGINGFVLPVSQSFSDLHSYWAEVTGLIQQSDGKIIASGIAGSQDALFDYYPTETCLIRYNVDGSIDSSFGVSGFIIVPFDSVWAGQASNVMLSNNGNIYLTNLDGWSYDYPGVTFSRPPSAYRTFCYDSTGHLDSAFGINGGIFIPGDLGLYIYSSCIQSDQKILFCGSDSTKSAFSLVRYTVSGVLDSTFGINGIAGISCDASEIGAFYSLCVQTDGKILATKNLSSNDTGYFKISRFTPNGDADNTFGRSGCVSLLTSTPGIEIVNSDVSYISQFPDGTILAAASTAVDTIRGIRGGFAFTRLLPDGEIDSSFSSDGLLYNEMHGNYFPDLPIVTGLVILDNKHFIASGGNQVNRYFITSQATGIHPISTDALTLSPNPSTDRLYINTSLTGYTTTITDMTGRSWPAVATDREIDVSYLPAGIYCLRLQHGDDMAVRKFAKE